MLFDSLQTISDVITYLRPIEKNGFLNLKTPGVLQLSVTCSVISLLPTSTLELVRFSPFSLVLSLRDLPPSQKKKSW